MAKVTRATPPARTPPLEESDEADRTTLQLARDQGFAMEQAANYMINEEADDGDQTHAGDWLVAYAVESAEGMYEMVDGVLTWMEPGEHNCHVEVSVRDAADGRFVPALDVTATLIAPDGTEVGTHVQPFLWHPWLYHYGRNWTVPGDGEYTLRIHVDAPTFGRHDPKNGLRYADPVDVEFTGVKIETGRK